MELSHNPLNYQRDYIDKMKFSKYEKSICAAYELVMRNPKVIRLFKNLSSILQENELKEAQLSKLLYIKNLKGIDHTYLNIKLQYSQKLHFYENYGINHIALEIIIYLKLKRKSFSNKLYKTLDEKFKKQVPNSIELIMHIDYLIETQHKLEDKEIIIKKLLNMCHSFLHYNNSSTPLNLEGIESIYYSLIEIGEKIKKQNQNNIKLLDEENKYYEEAYRKETSSALYQQHKNDINTMISIDNEQFELEIQAILIMRELSKEYLIDTENNLHFDYPFFSSDEKNILTKHFEKMSLTYKELQQNSLNKIANSLVDHMHTNEIISKDKFKITRIFEFDNSLFSQLQKISYRDNELLYKLIDDYEADFIKLATAIQYDFARPKLFSLKANNFSININMNHSKSDILSQIEYLIDEYQFNQQAKESAISYICSEFIKYSLNVKSNLSIQAPTMDTILDKIHQLCYVYDAKQLGHSKQKIRQDVQELSEGKIDQYYHYAKFLIEEKYYQTLIIGAPQK